MILLFICNSKYTIHNHEKLDAIYKMLLTMHNYGSKELWNKINMAAEESISLNNLTKK